MSRLCNPIPWAIVAVACFFAGGLHACQVPVFRYALENWEPDRLEVFVIHDGPLTGDQLGQVNRIEDASFSDELQTNLRLHTIDATADHNANSIEAFVLEKRGDGVLPQLQVYYSFGSSPQPDLAWTAEFNSINVDRLLTSPKRDEVVKRLLDGQSGVWVLLKSGNDDADKKAEAILRRELEKQAAAIELPSITDLATEEKFDASLGVDLRVEFSIITLDRQEESEAFFHAMLFNSEADLHEYKHEPIAIPIYGRGRTFYALVGPGLTPENIEENCRFICGACSCEIKSQNPGRDLLLAANWAQVEPGNWVSETPLPALTGIGQLDMLAEASLDEDTKENTPSDSGDEGLATADVGDQGAVASVRVVAPLDPVTPLPWIVFGWCGFLLVIGLGFTMWRRK